MIICICNNIKQSDLDKNPKLILKCGTKCGKCIEERNEKISSMRLQLVE